MTKTGRLLPRKDYGTLSVCFADSSLKGRAKDGGVDCHTSDIGHWFAMTCGGREKASSGTMCHLPL